MLVDIRLARLQSLRNERGASTIEYALLIALIAAVIIAAIGTVGVNLNVLFENIGGLLEFEF